MDSSRWARVWQAVTVAGRQVYPFPTPGRCERHSDHSLPLGSATSAASSPPLSPMAVRPTSGTPPGPPALAPFVVGVKTSTPSLHAGKSSWPRRRQLLRCGDHRSLHIWPSRVGIGGFFPLDTPQLGIGAPSWCAPLRRSSTWSLGLAVGGDMTPLPAPGAKHIWSHLLVGIDLVAAPREPNPTPTQAAKYRLA